MKESHWKLTKSNSPTSIPNSAWMMLVCSSVWKDLTLVPPPMQLCHMSVAEMEWSKSSAHFVSKDGLPGSESQSNFCMAKDSSGEIIANSNDAVIVVIIALSTRLLETL